MAAAGGGVGSEDHDASGDVLCVVSDDTASVGRRRQRAVVLSISLEGDAVRVQFCEFCTRVRVCGEAE